jgi:hypothetical protein
MARLGSFAASVDTAEALRPWAQNGVEFLLIPGGITECLTVVDDACAAPAEAAASPAPSPALTATAGPAERVQNTPPASPAQQRPAQQARPSAPAETPRWPEPWRSLASRVKVAPRVLLTYTDLAVDLSGTPHPGRRKLMRDVLAYAGWPSGSALFWPLAALKEGKPLYSPTIFVAGVRHYGLRTVLCFGQDAFDLCQGLLPGGDDHDNITLVSLPHPSELVDLLPHELHQALRQLKTLTLT